MTGPSRALAPPELIELGIYEKFGWTPDELDNVDLARMQRIFIAMQQREISRTEAEKMRAKMVGAMKPAR